MKIRVNAHARTISGEGVLDEKWQDAELETALKGLAVPAGEFVRLDLSEVSRGNSAGIKLFLNLLQRSGVAIEYVNCPPWLVEAINLINEFFLGGSRVASVVAEFTKEPSGERVKLIIKTPLDFLESSEYQALENGQGPDGSALVPEFEPQSYFHFVRKMKKLKAAATPKAS